MLASLWKMVSAALLALITLFAWPALAEPPGAVSAEIALISGLVPVHADAR